MNPIKAYKNVLILKKYMGLPWIIYRLYYIFLVRSGFLRIKMPKPGQKKGRKSFNVSGGFDVDTCHKVLLDKSEKFFFNSRQKKTYQSMFNNWDLEQDPIAQSDELEEGIFRYFSWKRQFVGLLPDWHRNPFTNQVYPNGLHWSQIPDFKNGDIKMVWEINRFDWVYVLVRAYWRTGNKDYPELFWRLVNHWIRQNPVNTGVNWKCGQEIGLRLMALCFGLYGFLDHAETLPENILSLYELVYHSAVRIEKNIHYAISQKNNHAISEAAALFTTALLFNEFKEANRWETKARRLLEQLCRRLIYDDGSFAQHSVNYHRMMLQLYLWVIRLAQLNDKPFDRAVIERVKSAGNWLFQILNLSDGRVPYYGQNDGAYIMQLNTCGYKDFRPVINAVYYLAHGRRCLSNGPWDEDLFWFFGPDSINSKNDKPVQQNMNAQLGGYYTLRSHSGFAFTRSANYRHRPGQADLLHVDLWWQGQNIAIDPGTRTYNAAEPWNNPFAHTAYHNTVSVNGKDQMDRLGRFLWAPWPLCSGKFLERFDNKHTVQIWMGSHSGYSRNQKQISHQRAIINISCDRWLVLDWLSSQQENLYRLHWLLEDFPFKWDAGANHMRLETPKGFYHLCLGVFGGQAKSSFVRADEATPRGWQAPYYSMIKPVLSVDMTSTDQDVIFWSYFTPAIKSVSQQEQRLVICDSKYTLSVHFNAWARLPEFEFSDMGE
ncbi:MAG: hypothetical protein GY874_03220 [Desulfobacteraceae bacterium]|nr:hypothetical protein [Desulfobacteraceae bacterium]